MKNSQELLNKAGILPKLRLGTKLPGGGVQPTGAHKVKVLEDKIVKQIDPNTGKEVEYVSYVVEENGEKKVYSTHLRDKNGGLSYLVQRFAEIKEGDEVILEMKKQGIKNYIELTPAGKSESMEMDGEEDIDLTSPEVAPETPFD